MSRLAAGVRLAAAHLAVILPPGPRRRYLAGVYDRVRMRDRSEYSSLRVRLLRLLGARVGRAVVIKSGVIIDNPERLAIGDNVSIQHNCVLSCYGGLTVGSDVSIAHGTSIVTSSHPYRNRKRIRAAALEAAPVVIGSNVWIGMHAMITMGVTIGSDVVVGAGSLVNRAVADNTVVHGIPARVHGKVHT